MLRIETGLLLLAIVAAFGCAYLRVSWLERLEHRLRRFSLHRGLSVALIGLATLGLRAAVLPLFPIPEPVVHDEFGYLLAADTFVHGRLTNPTHPMWVHFESFNILQKPTYQSFTPPVQGLILAFGNIILGRPFWGVWLSAGLMCAAITSMLQAWLPEEWALLGGILAVFRYGVVTYWANSYWGGATGAIGGALVLGALPRIKNSHRVRDSVLMGLGLAILANNRPYEGFVFSLPIAVALFAWIVGKDRPSFRLLLKRVVLPLTAVLALTVAGMGYYLWRVTGSPVRLPYQIERETYAVAPYMLWQHPRPEPVYHHAVIRKMYIDEELVGYRVFRTPIGMALKAFWAWKFYLGPLFTFPFLMLVFVLPYGFSWSQIAKKTWFLLLTFGCVVIGCMVESFYAPHYSSPATGLVIALVLVALRVVSKWSHHGKPVGVWLTRSFLAIAGILFVLRILAEPLHMPLTNAITPAWNEEGPRSFGRASIERQLLQLTGQQLVIVRYTATHEPFVEWVYNDANIDRSKVVWAREMDPAENQKLIDYFKDRRIWLLEADENPALLTPYGVQKLYVDEHRKAQRDTSSP